MAWPLIMQQVALNTIIPEQDLPNPVAIPNPLLSYEFEEALNPDAGLPIMEFLDGTTC